jgi:hypothetical protein
MLRPLPECFPSIRAHGMLGAVLACLAVAAPRIVSGQETAQEAARKRRFEQLQSVIDSCRAESSEIGAKAALTFARKPLLRYSDATRGQRESAVWRLGETGRPTAVVTLEIYVHPDQPPHLSHEFVSLTERRLTVTTQHEVVWTATGTGAAMKELPNSPAPAKTEAARLVQMRKLAQRFAAREDLDGNKVECRLLSQPIDRYKDASLKITDAAIFVFANGTNPETGLVLETDGTRWSYGVFRLGAASLWVNLDGAEAAHFPAYGRYGEPGPYMAIGLPLPE